MLVAAPAIAQRPAAPLVPAAQAVLRVDGRVVRPSLQGEVPVPGVMVTIHRVSTDSSGPVDSIRTDASGRYHLQVRRWGSPDAVYFAASVYRGIAYFSAPLRAAVVTGDEGEIVVFDTTSRPVPLTVQGHHYVIGAPRPTGLRDIVEVYEVSNDTVVTAVGRDSLTAVWSAPLPKGATGFTASAGDVAASSLRLRDGRVVLLAPFGPGVKQLSFTYALGPSAFPLVIALDRPNAILELLVEEPGAQVRGASLRSQGAASTQGRTFKRFLAQNAPVGDEVRIDVPSSAADARSTVVIALAVGLVLAMVVALAIAYRRGGYIRVVATPRDATESLAAAIAALDARHEANDPSLSAAAYATERAALKARLATALAARTTSA
ncbi:MAG: hypothetical protein JWL95_1438 [Gemmatimonadetes bacterium]|nr:hypothetical protein [Gemmatimonadota bacterium]